MVEYGQTEDEDRIKVNIHGVEYTISGDIDEDYVKRLAKYVDEKMWEVAESNALTSDTKIAVLVALNIANELFIMKESNARERKEATRKTKNLLEKIEDII